MVSASWAIPVSSFAEIGMRGWLIFSFNASILTAEARSVLLYSTIAFLSFSISMISSSFSSSGVELSTTYNTRSAPFATSRALETPIFSTTSSVSRIPAVSTIFSVIPWRVIYSSRISLVVPSISVTMALFSPTRRFNRDDLPAFGLPTITVSIPSRMILPSVEVFNNSSMDFCSFSTIPCNFCGYPSRLICSGSSRADSIKAIS